MTSAIVILLTGETRVHRRKETSDDGRFDLWDLPEWGFDAMRNLRLT
jgi:hypothetical protein